MDGKLGSTQVILVMLVTMVISQVGCYEDVKHQWQAPYQNDFVRRNARRLLTVDLDFFDLVGSDSRVDLVIIMDRSRSMTAHTFYTVQVQLIEDMLRYYLNISPDRVKLAVFTVGVDKYTVVFDGVSMSSPNYKCEIFLNEQNDRLSLWNQVKYDYSVSQGATDMNEALEAAHSLLKSSPADHKFALVTWDGVVSNDTQLQEILQTKSEMEDRNITLYVVGCGPNLETSGDNPLQLASSAETYGNMSEWISAMAASETVVERQTSSSMHYDPPYTSCPYGGQCNKLLGYRECLCDQNLDPCYTQKQVKASCADDPCVNDHGRCVDGIDTWVCLCEPGFTGRFCEVDENECSYNLCRNGARCTDKLNDVWCHCSDSFCGVFCEQDSACPPEPGSGLDVEAILLASIPAVIVLIIFVVACVWMCRWVKRNVSDDESGCYDNNTQPTDTLARVQLRHEVQSTILLPSRRQLRRSGAMLRDAISRRLSFNPNTQRPLPEVPVTSIGRQMSNVAVVSPTHTSPVSMGVEDGQRVSGGSRPDIGSLPKEVSALSQIIPIAPIARHSNGRSNTFTTAPAPPPLRPRSTSNSVHYQNMPATCGMEEWQDYVMDIHGEQEICIIKIGEETTMWIATSRSFHIQETQQLLELFMLRKPGVQTINKVIYTILSNDGTYMSAVTEDNKALCVAKTNDFLIFCQSDNRDFVTCRREAELIVTHLRRENR